MPVLQVGTRTPRSQDLCSRSNLLSTCLWTSFLSSDPWISCNRGKNGTRYTCYKDGHKACKVLGPRPGKFSVQVSNYHPVAECKTNWARAQFERVVSVNCDSPKPEMTQRLWGHSQIAPFVKSSVILKLDLLITLRGIHWILRVLFISYTSAFFKRNLSKLTTRCNLYNRIINTPKHNNDSKKKGPK